MDAEGIVGTAGDSSMLIPEGVSAEAVEFDRTPKGRVGLKQDLHTSGHRGWMACGLPALRTEATAAVITGLRHLAPGTCRGDHRGSSKVKLGFKVTQTGLGRKPSN